MTKPFNFLKRLIKNSCSKALLILFTTTAFFTSCKQENSSDIIIKNGKLITVDANFSIASAIAIKGDKIIAVGTNKEIERIAGDQTKIIDVKGKTVIPGLIDAHAHPEQASVSELYDAIPDPHTISELLEWIKDQASKKKKGEWIIHPKLFYTRLAELKQPTLAELDEAAPLNPVFLNGSYGGIINSAAMKASGFNEKKLIAGELNQDTAGNETGFIKSSDFSSLKLPVKEPITTQRKVDALKKLFSNYNKHGITGVISGYADLENYNQYNELSYNSELTVRVTQNFKLPYNLRKSKERLIDSLRSFPIATGKGNEWIRTGSMKIFLDGGILTGTAYLRETWGEKAQNIYNIKQPEYRGVINYTPEDLVNVISAAFEADWAITAHCTGGGGVDMLLDAFEEVNKTYNVKDFRSSIIHGNFFTEEAMERMQKLGIIANIQAPWFYKDADAMHYILGEERIKSFNPYHSMIKSGVHLSGGSDHMVKMDGNTSINPYNPFLAMWSMITRTTEKGNVISPQEAISREDALKMYTINNAYTTFEESIKGSLEVGKLADLVVLSHDFLSCPVDQIKDIESELTLVGGKIVYSSNQ